MRREPRPLIPWWPSHAAGSQALVRIPARGPIGVAVLLLATLGWLSLAGPMMLAGANQPLALVAPFAAVLATSLIAVLRSWTLGTYVNDVGIVVRRFWRTRRYTWAAIDGVDITGTRVDLRCRTDGNNESRIRTHVRRWSLDLVGSRSAFLASAEQLCRWLQAE